MTTQTVLSSSVALVSGTMAGSLCAFTVEPNQILKSCGPSLIKLSFLHGEGGTAEPRVSLAWVFTSVLPHDELTECNA